MIRIEDKGLGFKPGPVDRRDFALTSRLRGMAVPKTKGSAFWFNAERLDQGSEGACVGFGWVQLYNSSPTVHHLSSDCALDVYREATYRDEWPDEDWRSSSGTSVRAGAKEMVRRKLIGAYAFTSSVSEIAMWVLNKGPVVIGVDWLEGMDEPNRKNGYFIKPIGGVRGGHCTLIDGVRCNGDSRDYVRILNSWGTEWGYEGRAKMSMEDFAQLIGKPDAAACTAVELI